MLGKVLALWTPSSESWHQTLNQAWPCSFVPSMLVDLRVHILQASELWHLSKPLVPLLGEIPAPRHSVLQVHKSGSPLLQLHRFQWSLYAQHAPLRTLNM